MLPLNSSIDEVALHEISLLCGIDPSQIEDVYHCTPSQQGILADSDKSDATYAQRHVTSVSAELDIASLPNAINEVVARNQILRTRIVDSEQLGLVQVVLRDDPALRTRRLRTGFDQFMEEDRGASMSLATPLFRSAVIEDARKWVFTVHHAIFDHYFLVSLFDDVTSICRMQSPGVHAPYKQFVDYCSSISQAEAKQFWTQQFTGTPSVFPSVPINSIVDASSRTSRRIRTPADLASPALLPVYLECAWALLAHAYGGGDSVAYGVVYSGRNALAAWKGMETTLGPRIATLPTEVAIDPEDTVGELLKRRQLARQTYQGCGASMQIGLNQIRKVSESAKRASGFQTVINIFYTSALSSESSPIRVDHEDDVHRAFAISLTFSIESGVDAESQGRASGFQVLAEFDESLVSLTTMNRLLVQLEHILQTLARVDAHTRIGELNLLSSRDRLDTLKWNSSIVDPVNETVHAMVRKMAVAYPDDAAVDAWDGRLTYLALVTMADNLVRRSGYTSRSRLRESFTNGLLCRPRHFVSAA